MKLTATLKLNTDKDSFAALSDTLREANKCCNWLSERAWQSKVFGQFALHRLAYHPARKQFPKLKSQIIVRLIGKVAESYIIDKKVKHTYRETGAIPLDNKMIHWYFETQRISIWSTAGRLKLEFTCGTRQKELIKRQQGQTDLILRKGKFYLGAVCNVDDPAPQDVDAFLGIDLGVTNISTDSDGEGYSGSTVKSVRHRHRRLRVKLQKIGTKSAKRRLKCLSGREARFAKDVNHCISKKIVAKAECTKRGIALEELTHIRSRIKARRNQRAVLHSWSFAQLRTFIVYKAMLAGVVVRLIDPRNTSRQCFQCGHIAKGNRPDQSTFRCISCSHRDIADLNAAKNIGRAAVNQPNVASCAVISHNPVAS